MILSILCGFAPLREIEYLVAAMRQNRVFWFARREGIFVELAVGSDGILRSEVFPGLWLDPVSLLGLDRAGLKRVLHQGLDSPEHLAFIVDLARR